MRRSNRMISGAVSLAVVLMGGVMVARGGEATKSAAAGAESSMTLRQAAGDRLLIGAAVMSGELERPDKAKLIGEQFNCLTAENEMKPDSLQHVKGEFTFDGADKIVAFAQAHGMKVIGHTLCWHNQSPAWMYMDENRKPLPREVALENLKKHIQTVMGHFKGKVKGWDVVNEALGDSEPYLRDTPARRAIGDDYIIKAFEFAHEADPGAELYYNDYNIERNYKRQKAVRLIRELKAAGVKIDAVGVQGHWLMPAEDSKEAEDGIKALIGTGVKVNITELDVDPLPRKRGGGADINATERGGMDPYKDGLPEAVQKELAERYRALFTMFLKYPQIERVTLWGLDDGSSWLNNFPLRGRRNYPMLFDRELKPKPAFGAVVEVLREARK